MTHLIKKVLLLCFIITIYESVSAQDSDTDKGSIKGQIRDENKEPVVYANLSLLRSKDSTLVTYTTTNPEGRFEFQKQAFGTYLVKAESIGYQTTISKPAALSSDDPTITMDTLFMPTDANQLSEVRISAIRPTIEHKPGQTNINIENSSLSSGNSLRDILQKSPGVFVDQNGQISLNGKNGIQVMIDGQDSHLTADQLANFLESTPAESISKIELMNNPSEKYSAEGTAGIINIVMKKNKNQGIKGSLQTGLTYGPYWRNNSSANLSYNDKKISLYADYSYRHYKNKNRNEITRFFEDSETGEINNSMDQESDLLNISNSHSTRLGMDYQIDEKQRIGIDLKASFNHQDLHTDSPVNFRNEGRRIDSISQSKNTLISKWNNQSANLHYNLDLDDKESTLAVNLDYNRYHERVSQDLNTFTQDSQGETTSRINRQGIQPSTISIYAAKIDYTQDFGKGYQLESGVKSSFVKSDNNSIFEIKHAGQWQNDPGNTNHFIYEENVNAAYASLHKDFEKGWSIKAGLRAEQVNIKTLQKTTDSINRQNYIDLFPNVAVSKAIAENHKVNLSYSRRINRPDYQSLNPFIYYIDEYSFQQGNPFLKPEYVDKLALSYIFKEQYSAEISYDHTRDIMTQIINQNPEKRTIIQTNDNLNTSDNFTLSLNAPVSITPWWDTYNSVQLYHNYYQGLYNDVELDKSQFSYALNSQQTFLLPGGDFKAELNAMYRSKFIMGAFEIKDVGMLSLGLQKSLWKDRAALKLNVNDVFQTLNFDTDVNFDDLHLQTHYISNSRSVNLTFTYNFGNRSLHIKKHEDSSIKEEENRLEKAD